ncbi:hypothetical protein LINGRAHAP2_LOCUS35211 [Linum grandiflorum]
MVVNWGVREKIPMRSLEDDLWMVECDSVADAKRIVESDRVFFGTTKVSLDLWVPNAGRSEVLCSRGVCWVRVRGIPLHLVSSSLFQQIGESCGGFIESSSDACLLGSVRLKVKRPKALPTSLRLVRGKESFSVSISEEGGVMDAPRNQWKDKLKLGVQRPVVMHNSSLRPGTPRRWQIVQGQGSRGIPDEPTPATRSSFVPVKRVSGPKVSSGLFLEEGRCGGSPVVLSSEAFSPSGLELDVFGCGAQQSMNSEIVTSQGTGGQADTSLHAGLNEWADGLTSLPYARDNAVSDGCMTYRFFSASEEDILEGLFFTFGLGPTYPCFWPKVASLPLRLMQGAWALGSKDFGTKWVVNVLERGQSFSTVDRFESRLRNCLPCPNNLALELPVSTPNREFSEISEDGRLLDTVARVADLFGLQLEGSKDKAQKMVLEVALEVAKRKGHSKSTSSRSRTELELRRLGSSGEFELSARARRSTNRYMNSIPFSDVA